MSKNVSGWIFDGLTAGPWNEKVSDWGCNAPWIGWGDETYKIIGSISTTLRGEGEAILAFGNCHNKGRVVVHKNSKPIFSANASTYCYRSFDFQDGDVINITEYGGIIQFNDFHIIGCDTGMDFFC